ncbi:uncharacterized protein LOC118754282 isoform X2 [Rhagoletis pomonella]|nr:uncharacterized protein LOC118754282 isoform X2 [Rhagoletis pomonella]XP_036345049.1 uncharacterized protein LOC118754282 isoform X2 [Rhagoletis pomonella]XP_036345050.1 uncharacterized protein LOC118754282 isoform X2 [Rhagoletis pomonella]XP_036345051.1 uncharacterized protein LOC118754282 isoform X2 [Rhagoletis pomonella]XP_036345052.1 uncharacterized protein LOC118754282 isoform X2 [Rhagoletis pomonella]
MARRTQVHSVGISDNTEELESPETIESASLAIQDVPSKAAQKDSSIIDPQPASIQRRYTSIFPTKMSSVYFPNKVLVGNFSADLIAERSAAFKTFLSHVVSCSTLRDTAAFLHFLQDHELAKACQLLDERRNEMAIPLLENCFRLLNKIFMDRSRAVLLILCRLVAACTMSPVPHHSAERWATLALSRYDTLCDIDLLQLYIPLLHTCTHLWWQRGFDQKPLKNCPTLIQAIHKLDPRTETI